MGLRRLVSPAGSVIALSMLLAIAVTARTGPFLVLSALVTGGMWALVSAGLALAFGVMNVPNFAHGELFLIGTLIAFFTYGPLAMVTRGTGWAALAPLVTIGVATVGGWAVGAALDRLLFSPLRRRYREEWVMNTFLLTVGVSVVMVNGYQVIFGTTYRGIPSYWDRPPVALLGITVGFDRMMVLPIALAAIAAFWALLNHTALGRAIRAAAQDEIGAQLLGIDLGRVYRLTFALSSALAALAGAALLFMFPSYPTVGLKPLYIAWTVVILAGLGNVEGAIVGGFVVALLQTTTSYFLGTAWEDVVPFFLIILILILRPSGLFGSAVKGLWEQ